jgi:hypothetical protein
LAENLWWIQGTLPNMSLKRAMTVARVGAAGSPNAALVIHNAIALDSQAMRELEAWGTPTFLLVPNGYHRLDAPAYTQRYPTLKVFAPRGSATKVREVVHLDGTYADFPRDNTVETVQLRSLQGVGEAEGAMLVRSPDGQTVILNDIVFNMDRPRDVFGFLFTAVMGSAPGPRISRLARFALVKDKTALKRELAELAALPQLQRLVVSHDKVAHGAEARRALELAIGYL